MQQFTHLYNVQKTLCFELQPEGTLPEKVQELLANDKERYLLAPIVKEMMNELHKSFITQTLRNIVVEIKSDNEEIRNAKLLTKELLYTIYQLYKKANKSDEEKEELEQKQTELRLCLSLVFTKDNFYGNLFNKEIMKELRNQVSNDEEKLNILDKFKGFFGYFDTFCTNRKNMYVADEQETAIPFRIANQNLPKFCDNLAVYQRLKSSSLSNCIATVYTDFEDMLNVASLDEYFCIDNYLHCLCQTDIQAYNYIIGGREQEGTNVLLKGLNQYINEYNQKNPKTERLPLFKPLFKQILSDKEKVSWLPEEFESDAEMLQAIKLCFKELEGFLCDKGSHSLPLLLQNIGSFKQDAIYIQNGEPLNLISKRLYGNYSVISDALKQVWKRDHVKGKRESEEKYEKKCSDAIKKISAFSFSTINQALGIMSGNEKRTIADYFANFGSERECGKTYIQELNELYKDAEPILNTKDKDIINDDTKVGAIKALLDQLKAILHFIEPLHMKNVEENSNTDFYNTYDQIYEQLDKVTSLYNQVRNRLSRKPYSNNKYPIYFENNSKLLGGWPDSCTETSDNGTQYGGYLFRKQNEIGEYDYFLGISANVKLFRRFKEVSPSDRSEYHRLNFYQLKTQTFYGGCYKTAIGHDFDEDKTKLITCILNNCNHYASSVLLDAINKEKSKVNSKLGSPKSLLELIEKKDMECYEKIVTDKQFRILDAMITGNIKKTMASVNIQFLQDAANNGYDSFIQAMNIVEKGCADERGFEYFPISQSELDAALTSNSKRLFLFKITNKDLSYSQNYKQRKSRGTDNLHTMFFKALMEGGYGTYTLGTGSLYFREETPGLAKDKPTHPQNVPIEKKSVFFRKQKKQSVFEYDIQKDRRFTRNMFKLHLSVKANYTCGNANETALNLKVIDAIRRGEIKHIIGIDRGERHLLYVTVIDFNGRLVDKFSMNIIESEKSIDGETVKTDYKNLLDSRMNLRTEQKRTWRRQENIKDLKEGYLSQVVHKLTKMIVDNQAIVVLENLSKGFMQTQIESSVYAKFEQMLITKLNLYIDKQKDKNQPGGLYMPLQLTSPYKSRANASIQNGVVFYIPAWNTSKIDPVTGFVNFLHPKYENIQNARDFISKFDNIYYDSDKGYFVFHISNYTAFNPKARCSRQNWDICTVGKRIRNYRDPDNNNEWKSEEIELTKEFKVLFDEYGIDYHSNLLASILIQDNKSFFYNEDVRKPSLFLLIKLMVQLRNSFIKSDVDYIFSPVADTKGIFYDSNNCGSHLPNNADANGAFNIARKGLMLVERILSTPSDKKLSLIITNEEWLHYVQSQNLINI